MPIGLFKLITGEEIVTEFNAIEGHPTDVEFVKPRKMMIVPASPTEFGVRMIPWLIGDPDGTFPISLSNIVAMSEAPEKLQIGYLKETSNIQIASADSSLIKK